jgi:hypothetical protein
MTTEQFESELEKDPFVPFRLHLVSGKTVDISTARSAHMMKSAVMVFHRVRHPKHEAGYDVIPLYNIERLEQLDESE